MKPDKFLLATASAIVIAASVPAIAADNMKPATGQAVTQQKMTNDNSVVRPLFGASIKAEDLIGKSVENFRGEDVGEIESVIVDRSGQVRAVVIGVGGFLGMGEHDVAIDWQDLYVTDGSDDVRIDMSEAALKDLPAYKYSDDAYRGKAFGDNRYRDMRRDERTFDYSAAQPRELRESASADTLLDAQGNLKASKLIGMEVVGSQQEPVGEISDIVLGEDGKPKIAIGTGGFVGIGERVVLIGWDKVSLHREKDQVQIRTELSEAELKKLPEQKARN